MSNKDSNSDLLDGVHELMYVNSPRESSKQNELEKMIAKDDCSHGDNCSITEVV